ncbi:YndJ family transporter [Actinoplanes sp. URMC 104]|uniref:YndJ family transporter n=1 Tax=Actinoplanes sp. URMC 104 TaxID=3423409 RepID=UPI003F1DDA99
MDRLSGAGWAGLHLVVAVCVLAFVPLGMGALGRGRRLVRWWPVAAVPAVVALVLPRGEVAGLLCVPYLVGCLAVPVVLRRDRLVAFAGACLPVAAAGLAAERGGVALMGFPAGVLGLTAAHFHVAGFGALLLLALADGHGRLHRAARWLAPAGVAVVGVGFLIGRTPVGQESGDLVELVGAGLLSAGLWLAVAARTGRAARLLFGVSVVTMTLALLYAAGQVVAVPHMNLTWMVLTHGVLNATAVLAALVVAWVARDQPWHANRWSHRISPPGKALPGQRTGGKGLTRRGAGGPTLETDIVGSEGPDDAGRERFEAASWELLSWEMHRRSGAWVTPGTPPAHAGQHMLSMVGVGRLRLPEPCEVVEVVRQADRTVMHYRALRGHTFDGDESFSVLLDADGSVRFVVDVRSRAVHWLARLGGPVVPVVQRLFIARCAAVLRRAARQRAASVMH